MIKIASGPNNKKMKRKNIIATAAMVFIAVVAVLSCNKQKQNDFGEMDGSIGKKAKAVAVTCPPIVLSGTISTPTTLLAGNSYLLLPGAGLCW